MSDFMATLGNALTYGGMVTVIGLLVVFTGLALLIVILMLMAQFFKAFGKSQQKRAEAKQARREAKKPAEEKPAVAPAAPVETVEAEEVVDDTELIAVIAAAIAAYEPDGKKLVVRRVRRVGGWNRAAREEQTVRF
ncbi:MAG: OadG family protein [Clostridia bacterium]|nr:OadG family protein [Clostridia bacterium]